MTRSEHKEWLRKQKLLFPEAAKRRERLGMTLAQQIKEINQERKEL